MRFVVAREYGSGSDTYATLLTLPPESEVHWLAEEVALWPEGTVVQWWTVKAADAGAARLMSTDRATSGPNLLTIGE